MAEEMTQGNLGKVPASIWNRFTEVKAELKATYPDALAALIEDHEHALMAKAACENEETAGDRNAAEAELRHVMAIVDALCVKHADAAKVARQKVQDDIDRADDAAIAWKKKAGELAAQVDELAPKAARFDEASARADAAERAKAEAEGKAEKATGEAEAAKEKARASPSKARSFATPSARERRESRPPWHERTAPISSALKACTSSCR